MSYVPWLSVGVALAICVVPVLLLRRPGTANGPDQFVPPAIIRNAWIAYAVRLSVFAPFFTLGAAGDVWPAVAGVFGFGAGVLLLGALRGLITGFVEEARRRGQPPSLHAFLAQVSGGDTRVRVTTAVVTTIALLGLAGAEAAALVVVSAPLVSEGIGIAIFAMLLAASGLCAVWAGANGLRYVSQALLGAVFVGVFGSAAFLLYLNASDLRPLPPHGAFALMALMACSIAILIYRQTKYIETPHLVAPDEPSRWRRTLGRQVRLFQRFTNVAISVIAVTGVVIAGMAAYVLGLPGIVHDAFAALRAWPQIPAVGMMGIALLALSYPLVDGVSWQNSDALAKAAGAETNPMRTFRRSIRLIAVETATMGVLVAAFGAIAALATDLPPDDLGIADFVGQLVAFQHGITDAALTLLLVGCFAMAMATMATAIGTALAILRLDIIPAVRPAPSNADGTRSADRAAVVAASAIAVALAAVWIVSGAPSAGVIDGRFFALALMFACLQLSLLPLLLSRVCSIALPARSALAVLGGGASAAIGSIATYAATRDAFWLWLAVPACLAAGLVLLAAAGWLGRALPPR